MTAPASGGDGPLPRGKAVGRYMVLDQIGAGGMGVVYRAYDPELDRKIALKVVRSKEKQTDSTVARARLAREAQTLARLCHPNVVRVFDVGLHRDENDTCTEDAELFVAMELIEGLNLSQWLSSEDRLRSFDRIVEAFVKAGRGLAAAHDVGVVHRDFKPSNVLVANDGRVCVTDFGLARAESTTELPLRSRREETTTDMDLSLADADLDSLTEDGRVVGTPGYMAPEQHARAHPHPHADQYAFCVALYEALYGRRPFHGLRGRALAMAKRSGPATIDFRHPKVRVPRWLRRVLVRGLQPVPLDRFAHINDLLAVLQSGLGRRGWRGRSRVERAMLVVAATSCVGAAAAWGAAWVEGSGRCVDSSAELLGVWDDAARQSVTRAFEAGGGSPSARDTFFRHLDAYAQRWVQMHETACDDTWVRGQQSQEALDQRIACLHRRLESVGATVDLVTEGDPELLRRAPDMAGALPELQPCASPQDTPLDVPRPADPSTAARYDETRRALAVAQAQMAAGRFGPALAAVEQLWSEVQRWADAGLRSEVLLVRGRLLDDMGEHVEAQRLLSEVTRLARSVGHRRIEAEAWLRLARVQGVRLQSRGPANFSADMAEATIRALGEPAELSTGLSFTRGRIAFVAGRDDEAQLHFEEALAKRQRAHGPTDYRVAEVLSWLAGLQQRRGDLHAAQDNLRKVIDIHTRSFGRDHPRVASATGNLGLVLAKMGRPDEALDAMRQGRAIFVSVFGPRHPAVAVADDSIADLLRRSGRLHEAAASFERALSTYGAVNAPSAQRVVPLLGLAEVEQERSNFARALELVDQAADLAHDATINPVILGDLELVAARALLSLGQPGQALRHVDRADGLYVPNLPLTDDRFEEIRALRARARPDDEAGGAKGPSQ